MVAILSPEFETFRPSFAQFTKLCYDLAAEMRRMATHADELPETSREDGWAYYWQASQRLYARFALQLALPFSEVEYFEADMAMSTVGYARLDLMQAWFPTEPLPWDDPSLPDPDALGDDPTLWNE